MRLLLAFVSLAGVAAEPPKPAAAVAGDRLEELVRQSPFVPAGGVVRGEASSGELELRGVVWDGSSLRFSIFDRGTGESTWARLDEEGLPFRARSFDHEKDTLTLEYQGRVLSLTLVEPQVSETDGAAPQGGPPPPLPTNVSPGPGPMPSGQPGGLPAPATQPGANIEDAQRLQQMADEVRRRRGVGPAPEFPKN